MKRPRKSSVQQLAHFTIRVFPHELQSVRAFYVEVLGLTEGRRPDFDFPGHWLYLGDNPIVHLAGNAPADEPSMDGEASTGKFNHVAFECKGLVGMRAHLKRQGVRYSEAPVPGFPLTQVFLRDPAGIMVELTYDINELPVDERTKLNGTTSRPHPMGQRDPFASQS